MFSFKDTYWGRPVYTYLFTAPSGIISTFHSILTESADSVS